MSEELYIEKLVEINSRLEDGEPASSMHEYVAEGGVSYVFELNEEVLGKIPAVWKTNELLMPEQDSRRYVEMSKQALQRTLGIPHTEQLVFWDEQTSMWCVEKAKGLTLDQVDTTRYSVAQYRRLLDAVELLHAKEVAFEEVTGNIMYDPVDGFTFIDCGGYEDYDRRSRRDAPRDFMLGSIAMLATRALFDTRYADFGDERIPDEAFAFQQLCSERYGKDFGSSIMDAWRGQAART